MLLSTPDSARFSQLGSDRARMWTKAGRTRAFMTPVLNMRVYFLPEAHIPAMLSERLSIS